MFARKFSHRPLPGRVLFGAGSLAQLPTEMAALSFTRALILCTPEQRDLALQIQVQLGDKAAGIFDQAAMHVPLEVARHARSCAAQLNADCAVAIGGGSTIGLGKAIALDSGLPILAIPTTYAGSEMTPIYGLTEAGLKKTGRDQRVLPRSVIYDSNLTLSLPIDLSITSGINAMAHAAEALYAADASPITNLMAQEGLSALYRALPKIYGDAKHVVARDEALYGAWLCGSVLGQVSMGLHHKLCHTLGGTFNLPHAQTHTIVLPHALAYNAPAATDAMTTMHVAFGLSTKQTVPQALFDLAANHGAITSLESLGMKETDIDRALELALQNEYPNPRPLAREPLRQVLENAFSGRRPL
jgi:maleylacetate reductase